MRFPMLFALLALVAGCTTTTPATNTNPSDAQILAGAKSDIDTANNDWLPALKRHDAVAIAAAYTDDGVFVAPDGAVTRGREAIAAMYAARFPKMHDILRGGIMQDGEVVIGRTTIYEWGHAWLETDAGRSGGSYLTVWQQQKDGHWRIIRNLAL